MSQTHLRESGNQVSECLNTSHHTQNNPVSKSMSFKSKYMDSSKYARTVTGNEIINAIAKYQYISSRIIPKGVSACSIESLSSITKYKEE